MKVDLKYFKNIVFSWKFFLILILSFFFLAAFFNFDKNLLGGEGNYFLSFSDISSMYGHSWLESMNGTGFSSPVINFPFPIFGFFSQSEKIGFSQSQITIFKLVLLYLAPFASIFWLLRCVLKNNRTVSVFVSFFYILNPFSVYHIQGMMFWNVAPLVVWPLVFGVIFKNFSNRKRMFLFFGMITAVFSFSFSNIPYLGIFQLFLVCSILAIEVLINNRIDFGKCLKLFLFLETSFFLFNSWWFINLIRYKAYDLGYTKEFALNWARSSISSEPILSNILSFKSFFSYFGGVDYFFVRFYNYPLVTVILFIPFAILLVALIRKKQDKFLLLGTVFIVVIVFLSKGDNYPANYIYPFLLKNVPLFIIFKSPWEKFGLLLVFFFAISLAQAFKGINKRIYGLIFVLYLLVCSIPFLSFNFIPDFPIGDGKYVSRVFVDKEEYRQFRKEINYDRLDYRIFSLPGSMNYQVTMLNHDGKYYRGLDPLLFSVNKPFVAAYSGEHLSHLFENLREEKIMNMLSLYGIGRVLINEDIYPSFGFLEKEQGMELEGIFQSKAKEDKIGSLAIFRNDNFLPHFYIPRESIISSKGTEKMSDFFSDDSWEARSAIFLRSQNKGKEKIISELKIEKDSNIPVLEFKKINPTKYRVKAHRASGVFPLVFSESFHDGWKSYLVKAKTPTSPQSSPQAGEVGILSKYKILNGNEEDQASVDELKEFIEKGWVTNLGDGKEKMIEHKKWADNEEKTDYVEKYNIDFVSKNFQGTIQNDNLLDGYSWETWFEKPIEENKNHLTANGYANSWVMDVDKVCKVESPSSSENNCVKNPDGSYDFEMIVEFWPQRLFYLGLFISSTTLLACLAYLGYDWRKRGAIEHKA